MYKKGSRSKTAARKVTLTCNELETILDESLQAVRVINSDFTVRRINRAFAEMTSVNQKDIVGKQFWKIFSISHCNTPNCRLQRILDGEKAIQKQLERKKKTAVTSHVS